MRRRVVVGVDQDLIGPDPATFGMPQ
jgi:hypothetical protein